MTLSQIFVRSLAVVGVMSALVQPSVAGTGTPTGEGATCTAGHLDAAATHLEPPDMPWMAAALRQTGSVRVRVDLDATGTLKGASIAKSSGSPYLDRAALQAVRRGSFEPEKFDCVGVAGSYAVTVDFDQ